MNNLIHINNLTKNYGKNTVLKDVNLSINDSDLIGLVGLNGCGKTTLFKCVTGLINCEGEIKIFGYKLKDRDKIFQKLMYVFDSEVLLPELSAYETLYQFINYHRKATREEILAVLKEVGLEGSEKKPVKNFSLGMKQRLNLAKIILKEPKLVLMDEPFNGIDVAGVEEMIAVIKKINAEYGTAFVVSSHQTNELEKFVNRIIVIGKCSVLKDKYIKDVDYVIAAVKLADKNYGKLIEDNFNVINYFNDTHYVKLAKNESALLLNYLNFNHISVAQYSVENYVRHEVMELIGGGR